MFNYDSVSEIRNYLNVQGIGMQKKFGQNFLINLPARKKILEQLPDFKNKQLWEIGPGIGAMTSMILEDAGSVTVFEIDRGFILCLKELFKLEIESGILKIVEGDGRKNLFIQGYRPDMILGNLPYNVGSGMIAKLLVDGFSAIPMVFTLQKEVVLRMTAKSGSPDFSSFSVLSQYANDVRNCGTLSSGSFYPSPEVSSAIVSLSPTQYCLSNPDRMNREMKILNSVLRIFFQSRRKTLKNNISKSPVNEFPGKEELMSALEFGKCDPASRAEALSMEDYRSIVEYLSGLGR